MPMLQITEFSSPDEPVKTAVGILTYKEWCTAEMARASRKYGKPVFRLRQLPKSNLIALFRAGMVQEQGGAV